MQDLVSYSSSLGRAEYHISFIPKYRHKIFAYEQIKTVCQLEFNRVAEQCGFKIKEFGFDIDHLHMVVQLPPNMSIASAVKLLKGNSARKIFQCFPWLRQKFFWGGNLWSPAYYFDTVGREPEIIYNYVRNQGIKGDNLRKLSEFIN